MLKDGRGEAKAALVVQKELGPVDVWPLSTKKS